MTRTMTPMSDDNDGELIRTSDPKWLEKALTCYRDKRPFRFIDDADLHIGVAGLSSAITLIKRVREAVGLTWKEIAQILVALGMSATGIWLVAVAVADPEPTSKFGILLAGGVVLILTG